MDEYEYLTGAQVGYFRRAMGRVYDEEQMRAALRAQEDAGRVRAEGSKRATQLLEACLGAAQVASYQKVGYFEVTGSLGGRWRISNGGMSGNVTLITAAQSFTYCGYPRPGGEGELPQADVMLAQALHLIADEGHFRRTALHEWWCGSGCGFDGCPVCTSRHLLALLGNQARGLSPGSCTGGAGTLPCMADSDVPRRVVAAGDWHGNTPWALHVIAVAAGLLKDEPVKLLLHCGDFGIWPGVRGRDYLFQVSAALDQAGARLWFVDGNHEDHDMLAGLGRRDGLPVPAGPGVAGLEARVFWLPRGHRWTWHGRTWLACGGGVSLDRAVRTEGENWWPAEEITGEQEQAVTAAGRADVMLTHDCPAGVTHIFPGRPAWWDEADVTRSQAHEERLQRIVDAVQPRHIIHGHLHRVYGRTCDFGYGPVRVTGLGADGAPGNYVLLDTVAMRSLLR